MSDQEQPPQQQTTFGQVIGGGLGSSEIVKNLPKSTGGEGMTREELEAKRAAEAEAEAEAKAKAKAESGNGGKGK